MTANGYKCLANSCYIIDEVLRLRQSQWCFPQLILGSERLQCELHIGEARELRTAPVFYHLFAFVRRLQYVLLPLQGFWQAVSDVNIHGLLYFFSTSSPSHIHLADCDTSQHCPQNFNTFKARPKSKLTGKQATKRSIFSTAHFTLSEFLLLVSSACSFTSMSNILSSRNLPR